MMIGNPSLVNTSGFGVFSDATGGEAVMWWPNTITLVPLPVPEPYVLDDRWNPKMWAKWFREFLFEKFFARDSVEETGGGRRHLIGRGVGSGREATPHRCRSSPLWQREWKMKLWVQSL